MKRIIATPEGAGHQSKVRAFAGILINVRNEWTRCHEQFSQHRFETSWVARATKDIEQAHDVDGPLKGHLPASHPMARY